MKPATGRQYERRLKEYLTRFDFFVMRAGGSGSRSKEYTPDLVAIRRDKILIIEVKDYSTPRIYLDERQVLGLKEIEEKTGGVALVCNRRKCVTLDLLERVGKTYLFDVERGKEIQVFF